MTSLWRRRGRSLIARDPVTSSPVYAEPAAEVDTVDKVTHVAAPLHRRPA